jgi:hypothetical protein
MRRLIPVCLWVVVLAAAIPVPASAGVPAPEPASVVDRCLNICPFGDITFTVVVRDIASNPVTNSYVWIDVCPVPSVHPCFLTACTPLAAGFTNAAGQVVLRPQAGGVSPAPFDQHARIFADGILLATRVVGGPDQDGDLVVTAADLAIGTAKLGTPDPTMDLDCDLTTSIVITPNDLNIQASHLNHNCTGPTPSRGQSWGGVKILYR